jgi:hypothetical protein
MPKMTAPAMNPYEAPLHLVKSMEGKLTDAEACDVKRRDIAVLVLLMVVTLGFYWFYLAYQWSKEVNGLMGRVKYQPVVVLIANIATCGLAGMIFESLFAFDLVEVTKSRGVKDRLDSLSTWVLVCNCAAFVIALIPFGILVALPLGTLASVLVQVELNKLAEQPRR